ncbi:hypothetical protein D3C78_1947030 [compost metagenome]
MALGILLPQQFQSYPFLAWTFEFLMYLRPTWGGLEMSLVNGTGFEESTFQCDVVPSLAERPVLDP